MTRPAVPLPVESARSSESACDVTATMCVYSVSSVSSRPTRAVRRVQLREHRVELRGDVDEVVVERRIVDHAAEGAVRTIEPARAREFEMRERAVQLIVERAAVDQLPHRAVAVRDPPVIERRSCVSCTTSVSAPLACVSIAS